MKSIFKGGKVSAHYLNASKSKPAPVKETIIPGLELLDLSSLRPLVSGPQPYHTALGPRFLALHFWKFKADCLLYLFIIWNNSIIGSALIIIYHKYYESLT